MGWQHQSIDRWQQSVSIESISPTIRALAIGQSTGWPTTQVVDQANATTTNLRQYCPLSYRQSFPIKRIRCATSKSSQ
jgi:hypothetical protein